MKSFGIQDYFNYINKAGKEPPEAKTPVHQDGWALYYCGKVLFGPSRYDFCVAERNKIHKQESIKKESLKIKPYVFTNPKRQG